MTNKIIIIIMLVLIAIIGVLLIIPIIFNKTVSKTESNDNNTEIQNNYKTYKCTKSYNDIDITATEDVGNNITAPIIIDVGKYNIKETYIFTINENYNIINVSLEEQYVFNQIEGYNYDKTEENHNDWEINTNQENLTKTFTLRDAPIAYYSSYMNEEGTAKYVDFIESDNYTCEEEPT